MRYPDDYDIVFTGHDTSLSGYRGASSLLNAVEDAPLDAMTFVAAPRPKRQHQVRHKAVDKVSRGLAPNTGAR